MVLAVLVCGLSLAGCTPALDGNGERGGTIYGNEYRPSSAWSDASAMADKYCGQYGRFGHLGGERLGWFGSEAISFDCVD